MPTRRKKKLRQFLVEIENNYSLTKPTVLDISNYIRFGARPFPIGLPTGQFQLMINLHHLTSSVPVDGLGCWDDVFAVVFGDPQGVGWERFGRAYFEERGGAVYIPPGVYPIRKRALDLTGKNVFGVGTLHQYNRTSIQIHASASASFDSVAYVDGGTAAQIHGIRFDANHKAPNAIRITNSSDQRSYFSNLQGLNSKSDAVVFTNCQGAIITGIKGETSSISGSGSGVVFRDCNATRATSIEALSNKNHWGIKVLGTTYSPYGASGGMYLHGRVENALSGGIYIAGITTPMIAQDCWIESVIGHGVKVVDSRGVTIERARITAANHTGSLVPEGQSRAIYHSSSVNCTVRNCAVESPTGGETEVEKFQRTPNSEVTYTDNYDLNGTPEGFNLVPIVSSSS